MTAEPDATQTLGYLEGRITEQSAMLQQLHTDMTVGFQQLRAESQQLRADMTAGFQQLRAESQQLRADMTAESQQLRADMTAESQQLRAESQQLRADMTTGLQQVNSRIDRVLLTGWIIGGAIIASQIGLVATLIVRGG